MPEARDLLFVPAGLRHDIQPAAVPFRTEDDLILHRPVRLPVMGVVSGHGDRIAAVDRLHVDVEVTSDIRRIGNEAPARLQGRVRLEARIERESDQLRRTSRHPFPPA